MKIASIALISVLLSGCSMSVSVWHTRTEPAQADIDQFSADIGQFSRKVHFIELMELIRDNWHKAPTPDQKKKAERLMYEANLVQQCANKRCWLSYGKFRITTEEDWIVIEVKNNSITKIDINEPDRAAKIIYG